MGKYDPWDEFFSALEGDEVRFDLSDLEELSRVKLPPSARTHPEWWSRSQYYAKWAERGWHARPQLDEGEVIFTRQAPRRGRPPRSQRSAPPGRAPTLEADLILVGCVAQKRDEPSAARDLYTSPLWKKRRRYAEQSGKPWAILSAEYGLLSPDEVVAPYDRSMDSQHRAYREEWSRTTADSIIRGTNRIGARAVEVHAGAAYLDHGLVRHLEDAGLSVSRPLQGFRIGEQLSWYGKPDDLTSSELAPRHDPENVPVAAEHVHRIAADYASGSLGESWGELPETRSFRLPDGSPVRARIWLTFLCAVDRARDAEALWAAGLRAWENEPWVFDPVEVSTQPFWRLAEVLRRYRLSQRHAQDAGAWRIIGETLASDDCPQPIRRAIDGGPADAGEMLAALGSAYPGGTRRFPLLSGPKIGPMWVRMMAYPGESEVTGVEVIPVAVDTHVQRVTEMLGLVPVRELDDRHRRAVQEAWFEGVALAGLFGGPDGIDGTAAALDPALWVLGKNGCSRCERERRKVPIGSICDLCPVARVQS